MNQPGPGVPWEVPLVSSRFSGFFSFWHGFPLQLEALPLWPPAPLEWTCGGPVTDGLGDTSLVQSSGRFLGGTVASQQLVGCFIQGTKPNPAELGSPHPWS